jgi:acyl-CoA oxidase
MVQLPLTCLCPRRVYSGQFCLTELGHGLDARNLETTATVLPDGSIDLHTPYDRAAKYVI